MTVFDAHRRLARFRADGEQRIYALDEFDGCPDLEIDLRGLDELASRVRPAGRMAHAPPRPRPLKADATHEHRQFLRAQLHALRAGRGFGRMGIRGHSPNLSE